MPIHTNCFRPNTEHMFTIILKIYLLFAFTYLFIAWHSPLLIPFSTISNISTGVNNSNFISVIFKHACHANSDTDRKWAGSSLHISIYLFLKSSNHLQVIIYYSEHTNHDDRIHYLLQVLYIFFCMPIIKICNVFNIYKNFLY